MTFKVPDFPKIQSPSLIEEEGAAAEGGDNATRNSVDAEGDYDEAGSGTSDEGSEDNIIIDTMEEVNDLEPEVEHNNSDSMTAMADDLRSSFEDGGNNLPEAGEDEEPHPPQQEQVVQAELTKSESQTLSEKLHEIMLGGDPSPILPGEEPMMKVNEEEEGFEGAAAVIARPSLMVGQEAPPLVASLLPLVEEEAAVAAAVAKQQEANESTEVDDINAESLVAEQLDEAVQETLEVLENKYDDEDKKEDRFDEIEGEAISNQETMMKVKEPPAVTVGSLMLTPPSMEEEAIAEKEEEESTEVIRSPSLLETLLGGGKPSSIVPGVPLKDQFDDDFLDENGNGHFEWNSSQITTHATPEGCMYAKWHLAPAIGKCTNSPHDYPIQWNEAPKNTIMFDDVEDCCVKFLGSGGKSDGEDDESSCPSDKVEDVCAQGSGGDLSLKDAELTNEQQIYLGPGQGQGLMLGSANKSQVLLKEEHLADEEMEGEDDGGGNDGDATVEGDDVDNMILAVEDEEEDTEPEAGGGVESKQDEETSADDNDGEDEDAEDDEEEEDFEDGEEEEDFEDEDAEEEGEEIDDNDVEDEDAGDISEEDGESGVVEDEGEEEEEEATTEAALEEQTAAVGDEEEDEAAEEDLEDEEEKPDQEKALEEEAEGDVAETTEEALEEAADEAAEEEDEVEGKDGDNAEDTTEEALEEAANETAEEEKNVEAEDEDGDNSKPQSDSATVEDGNDQDKTTTNISPQQSSETTEGQGAELNIDNAKENWEGFHGDKNEMINAEDENKGMTNHEAHDVSELKDAQYEGDGYDHFHLLHPKGKGSGGGGITNSSTLTGGLALLAAIIVCFCFCRYRRRNNTVPHRGKYSALHGSDDFFNGTFSDDISYRGKDSDDEMSYGDSDEEGGYDEIKLEMGGIHETNANGGLTLSEVNG